MSTEILPVPIFDGTPETAPPVPPPLDLVVSWLGDKKPSTREGYAKDLRDFARFVSGDPDPNVGQVVEELLGLDAGTANGRVLAYRNHQLEAGRASATIARRLAAIRSVVKLARTLGRVAWAIEVQAPRHEPKRDMRGPSEDEMNRVQRALKTGGGDGPRGKRDRAIVSLLFGVALRRSEVCGLELDDVDFSRSVVRVLRKGRRERAELEMGPKVARAVGDWVLVRGNHAGPLFVRIDRKGPQRALTGSMVWRIVSGLGKAAKLPRGCRPHGLRHAGITVAASLTENPLEVQAFGGHRKFQTTQGYIDNLANSQGKMARLVDKKLK